MSTLFLYTCPVSVITETSREPPRPLFIFTLLTTLYCMYTAYRDTMPATKSKCDKWTGLLSRSSSNHKLTAGVKKYSGHGVSFDRVTVSTSFLHTCSLFPLKQDSRENPRPVFVVTHHVVEGINCSVAMSSLRCLYLPSRRRDCGGTDPCKQWA